jgi:hypothetical protein
MFMGLITEDGTWNITAASCFTGQQRQHHRRSD